MELGGVMLSDMALARLTSTHIYAEVSTVLTATEASERGGLGRSWCMCSVGQSCGIRAEFCLVGHTLEGGCEGSKIFCIPKLGLSFWALC